MSEIIRLTQEFYQQRREATNTENPQNIIEANHVGWNSCENQIKAFEVITDLSWINWQKKPSILDIGCGYGKLREFLISKKSFQGKYLGIDIVPEFIEKAIQTNSLENESLFMSGDFLSQNWHYQKFDVVISLGGIGVNHDYPAQPGQKSREYAQKFISKAVDISNLALSLYFPNADNIDPAARKPRMTYHSKSEIENMVMNVCGKRCEKITFISYPDIKNIKTIAKIQLSPVIN